MRQLFLKATIAVAFASLGTASLGQSATNYVAVSSHSHASQPVVRDGRVLQRATPDTVAPNVYIAPRHVVEAQIAARDGVFVPRGYERVWMDDRLSLTRAHQTYSGQDQMSQFWNNRVPRRLVPRQETSGR